MGDWAPSCWELSKGLCEVCLRVVYPGVSPGPRAPGNEPRCQVCTALGQNGWMASYRPATGQKAREMQYSTGGALPAYPAHC